jgi:hypothetical protein
MQKKDSACMFHKEILYHSWSIYASLFFYSEDESNTLFWNSSKYLPHYDV